MNDQQLEHFRQRLFDKKQALVQEDDLSHDSEKTVALDQQSTGRLTRMDAMQAQEMALASKRRRKLQITAIDKALLRIELGDFGYCLDCDEEIAEKRLEYDPAATLCLRCAEKKEKGL